MLMAADILLYDTDVVPGRRRPAPALEYAAKRRRNLILRTVTFKEPKELIQKKLRHSGN